MANLQKKEIISSVTNSIKDEVNFALVQFDKISHKNFEAMRRELKKAGAYLQVIKNTLFEKSVNKLSVTDKTYRKIREEHFPLQNKSAILTFTGEWIDGLKKYYEYSKDNEFVLFKLGIFDKVLYNKDLLTKLAQLPGKIQLMAQLIGNLKNPMARTTRALSSPIQKLTYVLGQRSKQAS